MTGTEKTYSGPRLTTRIAALYLRITHSEEEEEEEEEEKMKKMMKVLHAISESKRVEVCMHESGLGIQILENRYKL